MLNKKQAALILVIRDDGKILAVSRKDDPNDFGLPGGKVEDETLKSAAERELFEETGLISINLELVFDEDDNYGYHCFTFKSTVFGNIETKEQGVVKYVEPKVLLQGSFGNYNKKLFDHLKINYS